VSTAESPSPPATVHTGITRCPVCVNAPSAAASASMLSMTGAIHIQLPHLIEGVRKEKRNPEEPEMSLKPALEGARP